MNINSFLFNSIINAKAKHLGRNHQFIYCQLPDGKIIKAYALTHVSSVNVSVVKFEGNYYCFCGSAPIELSRSTKQLGVRVKRQIKEQSLLFLLIDITKSLENDGVLQAINYINTHNYQFYQYLSFGDTTGYISEPLNKTNILTELQDYYDNYNPDYDDDFYCSEGTDLPENGIDALNDAILSIDNKYLVDLYLVTDNSKYSRNTSEPEDILNLIDEKINKLFIDIIQPKNIPSEQIVIEGFENNPYCSNSAITTVLVNDSKIGNYPKNSNILIQNRLKLIWDGGGEGKEHIINNLNGLIYRISPKRNTSFRLSGYYQLSNLLPTQFGWNRPYTKDKCLTAIKCQNVSGLIYTHSTDFMWSITNNTGMTVSIALAPEFNFESINFADNSAIFWREPSFLNNTTMTIYLNSIVIVSAWEILIVDNNISYYYDISFQNGFWKPLGNATIEEKTTKLIDLSLITSGFQRSLIINNQTIQSLQQIDVVKAICQPQIVPLTEPNSTLYTTSLPPSNKIIYLD